MSDIHWIKNEIEKHYKSADFTSGIDFDRNGKIDEAERTDLNGDGKVDPTEWLAFLRRNESQLKSLGGFFKHYYSDGTTFKSDNPIHDLLAIESEIVPAWQVDLVYHRVRRILDAVRKHTEDEKRKGKEISPLKKVVLVYQEMKRHGINFENQSDNLFVQNIINNGVDCNTSSYVVLAVAHELGWPVHLVQVPGHMFVRWDDGRNIRFNIDIRSALTDEPIIDDAGFKKEFKISQLEVDQSIFLKNLSYKEILGEFYFNRGTEKSHRGNRKGQLMIT